MKDPLYSPVSPDNGSDAYEFQVCELGSQILNMLPLGVSEQNTDFACNVLSMALGYVIGTYAREETRGKILESFCENVKANAESFAVPKK